jgi:hypothetical protein
MFFKNQQKRFLENLFFVSLVIKTKYKSWSESNFNVFSKNAKIDHLQSLGTLLKFRLFWTQNFL